MKKLRSFIEKGNTISDYLRPMQIPLHSAHTGFFLILSLFPCLLLLLGLLRYTDYSGQDLVDLLEGILPQSLMPTVESLIDASYRHTSGAVVSVSALAALWSASRGTYGLLWGLSAVYGTEGQQRYWRSRGISVVYTFLFLVALVLTLVVHVFGNAIVDYLWMTTSPSIMWLLSIVDLRFVLLLVLQAVLFSVMYALLPGQRHSFRSSMPGAVLASFGWAAYSRLFSIYVEHFTDYYNIFGSIYALALGMLWLYFCICILFYGGAVNRYLAENKSAKME